MEPIARADAAAPAAAAPAPLDPKDKPLMARFKQQQLPAWQPILTPGPVIVTFFIVAIVFLPIGIVLLVTSSRVKEVSVRYDKVCGDPNVLAPVNATAQCTLQVNLPEMKAPVYFYYKLENFYQNHRRYVKSRNDDQLAGKAINKTDNATWYTPCGLIAWSTFNDSFNLVSDSSSQSLTIEDSGIAWPSDKGKKFKNPPKDKFDPNDGTHLGITIPTALFPNFQEDERFIVWMRVAGLPTFRKLWGIIHTDVPAGSYSVLVANRFPVQSFDGKKSFVISTGSWAGGKNNFLGIAYIVVGALCFALAVTLFVLHRVHPRQLGDPTYLKWR